MKILVIDDAEYNCASARLTLGDHVVTVIDNVSEAFKILDSCPRFDAVLTDLMMPVGSFRGAMHASVVPPQGGIPAGLVFAIKASNLEIRALICADSHHGADWLCTLLDILVDKHGFNGRRISDRAKRVGFVELGTVSMSAIWDERNKVIIEDAGYWKKDGPRIKNWREAMMESGLFPEIKPEFIPKMSSV